MVRHISKRSSRCSPTHRLRNPSPNDRLVQGLSVRRLFQLGHDRRRGTVGRRALGTSSSSARALRVPSPPPSRRPASTMGRALHRRGEGRKRSRASLWRTRRTPNLVATGKCLASRAFLRSSSAAMVPRRRLKGRDGPGKKGLILPACVLLHDLHDCRQLPIRFHTYVLCR